MEMSTGVQTIFFHGARSTISAASGSNQKVELVPRIVQEFGIVGLRTQAATHEHQFLRQLRELRVERNGQREVGHRPALVDRYFAWIFVHHPDQEVRRVLAGRFRGGLAFGQRRHDRNFVPPALIPCAGVGDFAVTLLPQLRPSRVRTNGKAAPGTTGMSVRPMISSRRRVCATSSSRH
jgi:hypothetical protein